jgi:hypothetical protein
LRAGRKKGVCKVTHPEVVPVLLGEDPCRAAPVPDDSPRGGCPPPPPFECVGAGGPGPHSSGAYSLMREGASTFGSIWFCERSRVCASSLTLCSPTMSMKSCGRSSGCRSRAIATSCRSLIVRRKTYALVSRRSAQRIPRAISSAVTEKKYLGEGFGGQVLSGARSAGADPPLSKGGGAERETERRRHGRGMCMENRRRVRLVQGERRAASS